MRDSKRVFENETCLEFSRTLSNKWRDIKKKKLTLILNFEKKKIILKAPLKIITITTNDICNCYYYYYENIPLIIITVIIMKNIQESNSCHR